MDDADRNDIVGVSKEILLNISTKNRGVLRSHPKRRGEERGMMVVEGQEVSVVAVTPLVRVKPLKLRRVLDWNCAAATPCLVRPPWHSSSICS